MYEIGKDLIKVVVLVFILAMLLGFGWNAFGVDFLGIGDSINFGQALGFWLVFLSFVMSFTFVRIILGDKGVVNIHHHYKNKEEG